MSTQTFLDPYRHGSPHDVARQVAARVLAGPHVSILSTTNPDGSPQASVIFVERDGDDILFSTIVGRRKTSNMQRDPRVNLLVHSLPDADTGATYATVAGTVELTEDPGGAYHRTMYALHMGGATPPPEPGAQRLTVRLRPTRTYAPPSYDPTA